MASTVVTAITRGGESVGVTRRTSEDEVVRGQRAESVAEEEEELRGAQGSHLRPQHSEEFEERSRSQSPLTVQSDAIGTQSVASASLGPSILSTAAVAPSRSFGTRRANAAAAAAIANAEVMSGSRSMANRVVSFTTNDLALAGAPSSMAATGGPPSQLQENDGGGDSITMPDELDNFSDIADAFSNSARAWREEYEARLDAIHKRMGN